MDVKAARELHARIVSVPMLVARFAVAGIVMTAVLAALIAILSRQAGTEQAVQSAEEVTWISATGIAEPQLTDAVIAREPAALARFHEVIDADVVRGSLVRVKVWTADGAVVYSDASDLIGETFDLDADELEALRTGSTDSEISDLEEPENRFERPFDKLLEVYVGIRSTSGQPLLFEAYFEYDGVVQAGQSQWRKYAPPVLGGLVLLQLVQIPVAWSLARRLQRQQLERARLLQMAADASGAERRRIAADLHDGTVQELAGMTFTLDAARLGRTDPERDARLIAETATRLRSCIGELRSLLVDIYPPDLAEEGLPAALHELAAGLERTGVRVQLEVDDESMELPMVCAELVFRSAQEILRNVGEHSGAEEVQILLAHDGDRVSLVVDDDGFGFDADELARQMAAGHLGLRSLASLVEDAGGAVTVRSAPDQGTRIELSMPCDPAGTGRRPRQRADHPTRPMSGAGLGGQP